MDINTLCWDDHCGNIYINIGYIISYKSEDKPNCRVMCMETFRSSKGRFRIGYIKLKTVV